LAPATEIENGFLEITGEVLQGELDKKVYIDIMSDYIKERHGNNEGDGEPSQADME